MSLRIIAIVTLVLVGLTGNAQSDYIVSVQGDTLRGRVTLINGGKLDRVQVNTDEKKLGFTALQIKEVYFDNERFHAVQLSDNIKLMKLLKGGYLSLYAYRVENETSYSGRLLKKMDGSYVDLPILTFRGALTNFIKDCEALAGKVKSRELGRDDLVQIVVEYNQCVNKATDIKFNESREQVAQTSKRGKVLEFLRQIEKSNLSNKRDIADVLNDMLTRLESGKSIPSYQIEALKEYLGGEKDFEASLQDLIKSIQ